MFPKIEMYTYLRLTSDNQKDEETLKCIYNVCNIPNVVLPADCPANHINYPCHTHDNYEFHADSSKCRSITNTDFAHFLFQPLTLHENITKMQRN